MVANYLGKNRYVVLVYMKKNCAYGFIVVGGWLFFSNTLKRIPPPRSRANLLPERKLLEPLNFEKNDDFKNNPDMLRLLGRG